MPVEEAIVLAGGLGTRLRAVLSDVPKPLAPVAGRPFLAWVLDHLAASGIRRSILATGYMSEKVERFAGKSWAGMDIDYSIEAVPLGTGGAVRCAIQRLQSRYGSHVINGDTYLRYAPNALETSTREIGAMIGVALAQVPDVGRYGAVEVEDGKVVAFREKGGVGNGYINAGCYFLTDRALQAVVERDGFSLEKDVLQAMVASGDVAAFVRTDDFIDIGVPEDLARAQSLFGASA